MKGINSTLTALICSLTVGCGSVKKQMVNVEYKPQKQGSLASIKPGLIAIKINDQRPADERDHVSKWHASFLDPTYIFIANEPMPGIFRRALKQEFELNGHKVVPESHANPDATITLGVKRFYGLLTGVNKVAQVEANVSISRGNDKPACTPFLVSGTCKKSFGTFALITADPSDEISAALADFIHNLTFDSRFLEALK